MVSKMTWRSEKEIELQIVIPRMTTIISEYPCPCVEVSTFKHLLVYIYIYIHDIHILYVYVVVERNPTKINRLFDRILANNHPMIYNPPVFKVFKLFENKPQPQISFYSSPKHLFVDKHTNLEHDF